MFNRKYAFVATTLASAALVNVALAEESKSNIEEVIVKEQYLSVDRVNSIKSPTPIIDVPQSLSIITADDITERGIRNIGDIIDYTAGVNTSQGEGHRDAIVFRGVRSTADFFIDGARDDVQYYRPLYNIEQVEILRGPNALLFGRGGTGGILNRVTKKAEIGDDFSAYKSSVNTFGEYSVELDSNFATGEKSAFRLNAMYEGLENHRDFYDGERLGINPTAKFELSTDTVLDLSYEYIDHERFIDRGIPTGANGEPVEAFEDIVFADPDLNTTELKAHIFRAALQHDFSDTLKGNFSAFYGDYDKLYQNFYASNYDQALNQVELDGYLDTTERTNLILSGNLVSEFATGDIEHTLIFGAEYIDTSSDQDRYNAVWSTNGDDQENFPVSNRILTGGAGINSLGALATNSFTDLNDDTRVEIEVSSFYIQDQIALSPNLDVVLGARFDSFDIEVNNVDTSSPSFGVRTRKDTEVSPRAGVIYKPQENVSIYASYSESFLPRSGEQFANINDNANELDPDVFETAEVGVKWDFESGLSFTTAFFQNEQTRADRDNVTGEAFEIRGLEVEGFELQLKGQVTDKLYFSGSYTYLDGETGSGAEPRELPENMASLWSTYEFTDRFGIGFGVIHQSESFIKDSDQGTEILPSYTRFDAAAYYDLSDNVRLQLNIENLTDELYFPNAHSTYQATVGAPLNALFTISGKF